MIRFGLCLLVGFWPLMGLAQTYDVQSGEHEDFSRIVILYDNVPDWSFGRVEGGYEFRPTDDAARYDLSKVFDLIPKDRIAAVDAVSDGRLFLQVACECHADVFEIR